MKGRDFEWDDRKNDVNVLKHGISFTEATTAFFDPRALIIDDPDHSVAEARFILMGLSESLRLLVVIHCYRENTGSVRIISARKATRHESRQYESR